MTQRVVNYTYVTGNPVLPNGSVDVRDGIDNLQSFDIFMNADEDTYNQRDGDIVKTRAGAVRDIGVQRIGDFTTGCTVTARNQGVLYENDGTVYVWLGALPKVVTQASSPATTGGVGPYGWLDIGDASVRGQLSKPTGSTLIGYIGREAGMISRSASDKLSDWVNVKDFGAVCDGVTDDTSAIQAAFAHGGVGVPAGSQRYIKIEFPSGAKVKINGTVLVPGRIKVNFNGCRLYGNNSATMFESAKWVDGALVSNWGDPLESAAPLFDMQMENAVITDADLVFKWYFMTANCATKNFRTFGCNGALHAKECFYHTFSDIHAWSPTLNTRPAFFWEGDIQAQGVRKCFASNYPTGHRIQGFNDVDSFDTCGAEVCTTGIYLTGGTGESGGLQNLEFHNWYLEGNATAVLADAAFNYRQINFRNCFWSLNDIHISGETIRSGSIDESNVFNDSAEHPGYFRISNINNGREGFSIKLPRQWSTTNFTSPTIDTVTKYQVGTNVLLERDLTYANPTTSGPVAKTTERYGIVSRDCFGSSVGGIPTGVVPFCDVSLSGLTVTVTSRIQARAHEMVAFSFQAETAGGPLYACGTLINGIVMQPPSGQRPVTVSVSAGGNYIFSFSAVSSNPTSCTGIVRII